MAPANIPAETTVSTVDTSAIEEAVAHTRKAAEMKKDEAAAAEEAEKRVAAENIPSDVALRSLAADKAKSAGKPAVKALLDKYGAASVTAVPQESRIAFKKDLEAL
jgi:hypothetical protein